MALENPMLAEAWQRWQPTAVKPWNRKWAAHLYRRAAFGASREELLEAERLGFDATVELLLNGRAEAKELLPTLLDAGRAAASQNDRGEQLRGWWLYCMIHGGHPHREKLALFWHNHFATSINKVSSPEAMFRQNCLIREHSLGKFEPFLQAMSRDPAMLLWLDSNANVRGKPNENYAREVMELFSLGVGSYAEADIREAARAFTGWHTDGKSFRFNAALHDDGPKSFFGKSGNWDGRDIVKLILEQPAAARFLVGKLYAAFVSEIAPPEGLLEPLCESFRKSGYDIASLVKTILTSRYFYSERAFRKRIKGPVEFVLGAVKATYKSLGERDAEYRPLPHAVLVPKLAAMGQTLFAPPNVKGWPGGRAWLNTSTLLERANFAAALTSGSLWPKTASVPKLPRALDVARVLAEEKATQPRDVVRVLLDSHVPGGVRGEAVEKLVAFVAAEGDPVHRTREAVHAIMTLPEYQLA